MMLTKTAGRVSVARQQAGAFLPAQARRSAVVARAEVKESEVSTSAPVSETAPAPVPAAAVGVPASPDFKVLGATQEAINGRSAMLGFVAAVIAEASTHQTVWSQIAGKYVDLELVEKPIGAASLGFGAIVAAVTLATLVPKLVENLEVDSRSFGPFTPGLEKILGRAAMLGFSGLLLVELAKGSSLL